MDARGSPADVCGVEGTSLMCPPQRAGVTPTFLQPPHHEGGQDKVYKSPFLIETFLQTGSEPGPPVTLMRAGMYGPPGQTPTRTLKGM